MITDSTLKFNYTITPDQLYITRDANYPSVATITVTISNETGEDVAVNQIGFQFSTGGGMFDLTEVSTGIVATSLQTEWTFSEVGSGTYVAKPVAPTTGLKAGGVAVFQWTNMEINETEGSAIIMIKEVYSGDSLSGQAQINKVKSDLEINSFQSETPTIAPGKTATLSWATTAATKVTLSPGTYDNLKTTDSVSVTPTETTTYTLTAFGDGPAVSKQFQIVVANVAITSFQADHPDVALGAKSTLSWETVNAASVTLQPGDFPNLKVNDSVAVNPEETTVYTLTAKAAEEANAPALDATTDQKQLTVTVQKVVINSFTSSASGTVKSGTKVTLNWDTSYATGWQILVSSMGKNQTPIDISGDKGSTTVAPANNTTYTLVCQGASGPVKETVTIMVESVKIDSFVANNKSIQAGGSYTLSWKTSNADTIKMTANWENFGHPTVGPPDPGAIEDSGSWTESKLGNSVTYTLTATGPNGSTSAKVTVKVEDEPIAKLTTGGGGFGLYTLYWSSANVKTLVMNGGPYNNKQVPASGNVQYVFGSGEHAVTLTGTPTNSNSLTVIDTVYCTGYDGDD